MEIDTEEFIFAVQRRTAIWQSKHPQHLNRAVISKLWDEIKNLFPGSNDKQLRKKWKNLRDHFRKELKRYPPPGSGDPGNNLQSTWPYYQQISFIRDDLTAEESSGNLDIINESINDSTNNNADDTFDVNDGVDTTSQSSSGSRKRKCASDYREQFIELENKKIELLEKKLSQAPSPSNDDEKCEDEYFFKSLIPQMKAFPPLQKLRVKNKIIQLLMEETEKLEYGRRYDSYGYSSHGNMDLNTYNYTEPNTQQ